MRTTLGARMGDNWLLCDCDLLSPRTRATLSSGMPPPNCPALPDVVEARATRASA